jgi:hypothetical protein
MMLEHALRSDWSRLHFLTGGHAYKLAWRPVFVDLRAVRWHAPHLRGRILGLYDHLFAQPSVPQSFVSDG